MVMSAPMSDAFVMLAQTREGLGCFWSHGCWRTWGNGLRFQRLRTSWATVSNASSEVEFSDTFGFLLGTPDAGIRTILDMVTLTPARLRAGLGRHDARIARRSRPSYPRPQVFGKALVSQPMMTRVLADMALDVAAASALSFRLAEAFDNAHGSAEDAAYARIMTPVAKYWCCKIAPALIYEAMECMAATAMSRRGACASLPRSAGQCDLGRLRQRYGARRPAGARAPQGTVRAVFATIGRDLGPAGRKTIEVLRAAMSLCERDEGAGTPCWSSNWRWRRRLPNSTGLGAGRIADAFLESRLAAGWRSTYGMLDSRFDSAYVLDLLYPAAT